MYGYIGFKMLLTINLKCNEVYNLLNVLVI
jgi:hypothetical protein